MNYLPAMRVQAGAFTVHWGVNLGDEETASNAALSDWWHSSGVY